MPRERRYWCRRTRLRIFDDLDMCCFSRSQVFDRSADHLRQAGEHAEIIIRKVGSGCVQLKETDYFPVKRDWYFDSGGLPLQSAGGSYRWLGGADALGDWCFALFGAASGF